MFNYSDDLINKIHYTKGKGWYKSKNRFIETI